jgi:ABC-type glutathione transport system ATPase component
MNQQTKLLLALQQIDNISNLVRENNYEAFFTSHLLPIHYEIQRQLTLLKNGKETI